MATSPGHYHHCQYDPERTIQGDLSLSGKGCTNLPNHQINKNTWNWIRKATSILLPEQNLFVFVSPPHRLCGGGSIQMFCLGKTALQGSTLFQVKVLQTPREYQYQNIPEVQYFAKFRHGVSSLCCGCRKTTLKVQRDSSVFVLEWAEDAYTYRQAGTGSRS